MNLPAAYTLFIRECAFTWHDYMVASDDEVTALRQWAEQRKEVQRRHSSQTPTLLLARRPKTLYGHDTPGGFLWACTEAERRRLDMYAAIAPAEMVDLGQDPRSRPMHTNKGLLNTAIAGMGVQYSFPHRRFAVPTELLIANGWPATDAFASEACGAVCLFHPGQPAPPSRTRASLTKQLGNAQHVNSIGIWSLWAALTFDGLGMRLSVPRGVSSSSSARPRDADDAGFAAAFRKRIKSGAGSPVTPPQAPLPKRPRAATPVVHP